MTPGDGQATYLIAGVAAGSKSQILINAMRQRHPDRAPCARSAPYSDPSTDRSVTGGWHAVPLHTQAVG